MRLAICLEALSRQTVRPEEVVVIWQENDVETSQCAADNASRLKLNILVVHSSRKGIVPSENAGLDVASGDLILLLDDDAVPRPTWLERHMKLHQDPSVGAVGGTAFNHYPDGAPFPARSVRTIAKLRWYGIGPGNLNNCVLQKPTPPMIPAVVLAGNNMSIKRGAFSRFSEALRDYWQSFEIEACFQVKSRGYRVVLDLENPVNHYPTASDSAFNMAERSGDLARKIYNPVFNNSYVMGRYAEGWLRVPRMLFPIVVGSVPHPGVLKLPFACLRYGNLGREVKIFGSVLRSAVEGWNAGCRDRSFPNPS